MVNVKVDVKEGKKEGMIIAEKIDVGDNFAAIDDVVLDDVVLDDVEDLIWIGGKSYEQYLFALGYVMDSDCVDVDHGVVYVVVDILDGPVVDQHVVVDASAAVAIGVVVDKNVAFEIERVVCGFVETAGTHAMRRLVIR